MASRTPNSPPRNASRRFSVSSCCTSRPRRAPVAARNANSFCLAAPAASNRFATLAQPMSSTKLTVPSRKPRMFCVSPNIQAWMGTTWAPTSSTFWPCACNTCRLTATASASAACVDTPGFSRPIAVSQRASGMGRRSVAAQNAMSSSQGDNRNPFGITPITVRGSASTLSVRPMTYGAPLNCRCQVA